MAWAEPQTHILSYFQNSIVNIIPTMKILITETISSPELNECVKTNNLCFVNFTEFFEEISYIKHKMQ